MDIKSLNRNVVVNMLVAALLLGANFLVYNYQMQKYRRLQETKDYETKKNAVIEVINRLEKKLFAYKKILGKKDAAELVNVISRAASSSSVQISSIQPQPEEEQEFYNRLSINLNITTSRYHNLGKFISLLEKSPEIFNARIVSISGRTGSGDDKGSRLNAVLTVSTLIYKE